MNKNALDIMEAARFEVSERHPYVSEVLFNMTFVEAKGLGTMAVDARWLCYYDPDKITEWRDKETIRRAADKLARSKNQAVTTRKYGGPSAVLAHELGHILREHFKRMRSQAELDPKGVNMAQDREINDDVVSAGWLLPDGALMPKDIGAANGLTAEEYYSVQQSKQQQQQGGTSSGQSKGSDSQGDSSGDAGQKAPGCGGCCGSIAHNPTEWEKRNASGSGVTPGNSSGSSDSSTPAMPAGADDVTQEVALLRVAQAIREHVKAHGKGSVPAGMQAWSEAKLQPAKVDWRKKLPAIVKASLASKAGGVDFTYRKPGRRAAWSAGRVGAPIMPSLFAPTPRVAIVLDTSGSMGANIADGRTASEAALSEVIGVVKACGASCRVFATDCAVAAVANVASARDIEKINAGGGGTSMVPGFAAAVAERKKPDVVIIITDGCMGHDDWPSEADVKRARVRVIGVVIAGGEKPPAHIVYIDAA